jgi:hypothetical protein
VNKAIDVGFDQGLVSAKIEHTGLMVKLCLIQYLNGVFLFQNAVCRLIFSKMLYLAYSLGVLIHGHLPSARYVSWVQNDVNQFGLYLYSHGVGQARYLWFAQYARTSNKLLKLNFAISLLSLFPLDK